MENSSFSLYLLKTFDSAGEKQMNTDFTDEHRLIGWKIVTGVIYAEF